MSPTKVLDIIGDTEKIDILKSEGFDVNNVDFIHNSLLHVAAELDNHNAIDALLSAGCNINAKNVFDFTPADTAFANEDETFLNIIKSKGGQLCFYDMSNETLFSEIIASINYSKIPTLRFFLEKFKQRLKVKQVAYFIEHAVMRDISEAVNELLKFSPNSLDTEIEKETNLGKTGGSMFTSVTYISKNNYKTFKDYILALCDALKSDKSKEVIENWLQKPNLA